MLDIQNGKCTGRYASTILEKCDNWVTVFTPKKGDDFVELPMKTPVKVGLATKDAYYSFSSQVIGQRSQPEQVLVLDKPGVIYRTQRRQSPRISLLTNVRYSRVSDGDRAGALNTGLTRDVGIGGIGFFSSEEITPGQIIYVETEPVGSVGAITAVGQVLRCRKLSNYDNDRFDIGVKFTSVDDKLRSALV
jgi:c-di-GMP-binding flagellar brake protein YcgR